MIGPALILLCILAEIVRELAFKRAAGPAGIAVAAGRYWAAATMPLLWLGIALWLAGMLLWIVVLQHLALSVAYPAMALSYAGVPLASHLLLGERLAIPQRAGVLLIVLGVACVGLSGL